MRFSQLKAHFTGIRRFIVCQNLTYPDLPFSLPPLWPSTYHCLPFILFLQPHVPVTDALFTPQ